MTDYIVVSPAYGRDYKSSKKALEDWNKNLDFILESIGPYAGKYCNKSNFPKTTSVEIRYNKLTRLVIAKGAN